MWQQQGDEQQQLYEFQTQKQLINVYQEIEDEVRKKFKELNTDTLEEIKKNMKRKQNRISLEQNINLVSQQRGKIITEMNEHLLKCWNPQCKQVKQVTIKYGFSKNAELQDPVSYICNTFIAGLGYKNSECYEAQRLNEKMFDTHRIIRGI